MLGGSLPSYGSAGLARGSPSLRRLSRYTSFPSLTEYGVRQDGMFLWSRRRPDHPLPLDEPKLRIQ